eukprot:8383571-Pyramimonas_sp.AAC.2
MQEWVNVKSYPPKSLYSSLLLPLLESLNCNATPMKQEERTESSVGRSREFAITVGWELESSLSWDTRLVVPGHGGEGGRHAGRAEADLPEVRGEAALLHLALAARLQRDELPAGEAPEGHVAHDHAAAARLRDDPTDAAPRVPSGGGAHGALRGPRYDQRA